MAQYHDNDPQRHPTYLHLDSQFVDTTHRSSHISRAASHQSHASARTWIYNTSQQNSREPPAIIIPIALSDTPPQAHATPALRAGEPAIYDGIDGEEYMNIDPEGPDLETAFPSWLQDSPTSTTPKASSRGMIGGFFHRLRRFPKNVWKRRSRKRKQVDRTTMDTGYMEHPVGIGHITPGGYDDHDDVDSRELEYQDAPSMPIPEPATVFVPMPEPAEVAGPPPSRSAGMSFHHSEHALPSRVHSRASQRSRTPVPRRAPTPSEALSARLRSPIHSEPLLRRSNVAKTPASTRMSTAPSMMSQVFRLDKFFKDLKNLPWISTRITVDYVPGEGRRSHSKSQKPLKNSLKPASSWYANRRRSLDLLSSGSESVRSPYSQRGHVRSSSHSISSGYPSLNRYPSTRRATHGHGTARKHSRGYPMYPPVFSPYPFSYSPQPQPFYVMQPPPSQVNSPQAPQQTTNAQQTAVVPELCQAVPVYMVSPSSASPPVLKPIYERRHSKKRSQDKREQHPEIHPYPLSMPGYTPPLTT